MNDVNLKGCRFQTEIVPYLYGELPASSSSAFESHLLECGECTDEFAAVSNARYEVYDWKKLAFDQLETPVFSVPYKEHVAAASWLATLRAAFSRPWAIPGVAFAGVAVVTVLAGAFFVSSDTGPYMAQSNSNTPKHDIKTVETDSGESVAEPNPIEDSELPPRRPVRAPDTIKTVHKRTARNPRPAPATATEVRATPLPNRNAPRLNEFNDDEDTSLRLAQLFEDIDTRE